MVSVAIVKKTTTMDDFFDMHTYCEERTVYSTPAMIRFTKVFLRAAARSAYSSFVSRCIFLCPLLYTSAPVPVWSRCIFLCSRLSTSVWSLCPFLCSAAESAASHDMFLCSRSTTTAYRPVCGRSSCARGGRRSPGLRPCVLQGIDSALHG